MNTSDVHTQDNNLSDRLDDSSKAKLVADLQAMVHTEDTVPENTEENDNPAVDGVDNNTTETEQQFSIEALKQLIVQEFDQLGNGIELYDWMQKDIEAHIRSMLHIVNTEHDKESQAERMVASVARDIAETTISEDLQGPIARTGYNKQYFKETQHLVDIYRSRLVEVISALEQSKAADTRTQRDKIIDESVRKPLEHTRSAMYEVHEEMLRLLRAQRDTVKTAVESFQQLQYFKDEEVWQNPIYRLLNEYCEKLLLVIEGQIAQLQAQSKLDDTQITALAKESQLLIQRVHGK